MATLINLPEIAKRMVWLTTEIRSMIELALKS